MDRGRSLVGWEGNQEKVRMELSVRDSDKGRKLFTVSLNFAFRISFPYKLSLMPFNTVLSLQYLMCGY
jgi:hypothetical protein